MTAILLITTAAMPDAEKSAATEGVTPPRNAMMAIHFPPMDAPLTARW